MSVQGNIKRISWSYKVSGTATDPGEATLIVKPPGKSNVTYIYDNGNGAVIKDGVGNYHYDLTCDDYGDYNYRIEGTTPAKSACEGTITIDKSKVI